MNRSEIFKEMEDMFGFVPSFFKRIPDDTTLGLEWGLFKRVQLEEGPIPNKYRELIGVAVSAATRCRYCTLFHTEMARLNGATEAEIEDAVHFAKSSQGWSAYLNGLGMDYEAFKSEVKMACDYVRTKRGDKELRCRDVGAPCDFVVYGKTEQEIFDNARYHAKTEHDMAEIPPELLEKSRKAIHTVQFPHPSSPS